MLGVVFNCVYMYFNSIKVQLEHIVYKVGCHTLLYFNSIKVQLEHDAADNTVGAVLFQFHKGTIRTR